MTCYNLINSSHSVFEESKLKVFLANEADQVGKNLHDILQYNVIHLKRGSGIFDK